jgi:hypothetical protein
MRALVSALLSIAVLFAATPAAAIPRTWVSSTGGGVACTRAAPCATFQAAHDATDTNGEINCVDSGAFGGLNISKSITIDCAGTVASAAGVSMFNAFGAKVRLRNLTISAPGGSAVADTTTAVLFIENCMLTNSESGVGHSVEMGFPRLFITDSVIANNTDAGVAISPIIFASVRATIDGVRLERNGTAGLDAHVTTGSQTISVHVRNSVLAGNRTGVGIGKPGPGESVISVTVDRSNITLNADEGVFPFGSGRTVILGRSTVLSNGQGILNGVGAQTLSYQNNHLTGNVVDGAPTNVLSLR